MGWFVPLAIAGGAMAVKMKAQYEQGKADERQTESEAEWREYEAKLKEREAKERQAAASYEEKKQREKGERIKARQRAKLGQAGVLPTGSAFEVLEETASEIEADALMIRRSGTVGAQSLTAEAQLTRAVGRSALLRGRARRRGSYYRMASTGLGGFSDLYDRYGPKKKEE